MPPAGRAFRVRGISLEPASAGRGDQADGDDRVADTTLAHSAPDMDYPEHEKTYHRFVAMTKWGTLSLAVLLILMAIFLV